MSIDVPGYVTLEDGVRDRVADALGLKGPGSIEARSTFEPGSYYVKTGGQEVLVKDGIASSVLRAFMSGESSEGTRLE